MKSVFLSVVYVCAYVFVCFFPTVSFEAFGQTLFSSSAKLKVGGASALGRLTANEVCTSERKIVSDVKYQIWHQKPDVFDNVVAYIKKDPNIPTENLFVYDLKADQEIQLSHWGYTVYYEAVAVSKNVVIATMEDAALGGSQMEAYYTGDDGQFGTAKDEYALISKDLFNVYDLLDVYSQGDGTLEAVGRRLNFFFNNGYTRVSYDFNTQNLVSVIVPSPNYGVVQNENAIALVHDVNSGKLRLGANHVYGNFFNWSTKADIMDAASVYKFGGNQTFGDTRIMGTSRFFVLLLESAPVFQPPSSFLSMAVADPGTQFTIPLTAPMGANETIASASMGESISQNKIHVAYEINSVFGRQIRLLSVRGYGPNPTIVVANGDAQSPATSDGHVIYLRRDYSNGTVDLYHRFCVF